MSNWLACSECKSRRQTCSEARPCCVECRITGGWTHTRPTASPILTRRRP